MSLFECQAYDDKEPVLSVCMFVWGVFGGYCGGLSELEADCVL